ncbi:MAG TPA: YceI family protein [Steroidobacteraceae bacterium]
MKRVLAAAAVAALTALSFTFAVADEKAANEVPLPSTAPVPAGDYRLDKAHATLLFRISHLGFSNYMARFTRFDAQLRFDPRNPTASSVQVTIDPRSIHADGAPDGFLGTLAGKEWLDAERYPQISYRSTKVESLGDNKLRISGELTLHGVTKPVTLNATYNGGYASHPFEPKARIGFSATGSLKRSDFGISAGLPLPGSTFGVGDTVEIVIEAEFNGPPAAAS